MKLTSLKIKVSHPSHKRTQIIIAELQKQVQEDYNEYFNFEEGSVPWQYNMVSRISDQFDEMQ